MADIIPFGGPSDVEKRLRELPPKGVASLLSLFEGSAEPFVPLPGPQTEALNSPADELLYGGSAGGGKSLLLLGAAATRHKRSLILRRQGVELDGLIADLVGMVGADGFNRSDREHTADGRSIKLGGCPEADSWRAYAGRARDLIAFDEAGEFLEEQVSALLAWLRSTDPQQRCRAIFASNPPRGAEGEWLTRWFQPWLDPGFPNPGVPGELRWFIRVRVETRWVEGPGRYEVDGETYTARSRTFIPARLSDNPLLDRSGYRAGLENLPEPLRSQLLKGDFLAGREDDAWQIIPSEWIAAAQARWTPTAPGPMQSIGVDVAQGGANSTVLAPRHGKWFAPLKVVRGIDTKDGPAVAGLVFATMRDGATIVVDMGGGWGRSAYDHLRHQFERDGGSPGRVVAVVPAEKSTKQTRDGKLGFVNKRAELWWLFREALDPQMGADIALPPDPALVADLIAPRWKLTARGIQVELKDEIRKRLGRSPDRGDAAVMAWGYGPDGAAGPVFTGHLQTRATVGYAWSKHYARIGQSRGASRWQR